MFFQHMRDDDVYDEDEVRHLLQTGSESEHENVSTEMGYDADSEETYFDESEKGLSIHLLLLQLENLIVEDHMTLADTASFKCLILSSCMFLD